MQGNCVDPIPETSRSVVLVKIEREIPRLACAITFEQGGFKFEDILSGSPYRRLFLSNLVISSPPSMLGYGIQASKVALWMSAVEWSGFSNLAISDGAVYLSGATMDTCL